MTLARMMNSAVTVWRSVAVPDGAGGQSVSLAQVGSTRALISQPSASERMFADQGQTRHSHTVHLPPRTDVRRGDELRRDAQRFRVLAVFEPSRPIYVRADVELIQHG